MVDDTIRYPFRVGGRLPIGQGTDGQIVGVDPEGNVLVAGEIDTGCSTVMRVLVVSALEAGMHVTVVNGRAPGTYRPGEARHDYDTLATDRLLQYEDGTAHPATVIREIVAGERPRPELLVIDDAFDLERLAPPEVKELYAGLNQLGIAVVSRVMEARSATRELYATRILMGPASPMAHQLALGSPEAPAARRTDPVGSGAVRYSDGTIHLFRAYWIARAQE